MLRNTEACFPYVSNPPILLAQVLLIWRLLQLLSRIPEMVEWPATRTFPNIEDGFYKFLERNRLYVASQNSWIQEQIAKRGVTISRSIELLSNLFVGLESASSDIRRNVAMEKIKLWRVLLKIEIMSRKIRKKQELTID